MTIEELALVKLAGKLIPFDIPTKLKSAFNARHALKRKQFAHYGPNNPYAYAPTKTGQMEPLIDANNPALPKMLREKLQKEEPEEIKRWIQSRITKTGSVAAYLLSRKRKTEK